MKGLFAWEQHQLRALLGAMLPEGGPQQPGLETLDLSAFWTRFDRASPASLRLGLRASVWGLGVLAPCWVSRGPRTFTTLEAGDRDDLLRRASTSRLFIARQLVTVLKVVACLAYFDDPTIQARVRAEGAP